MDHIHTPLNNRKVISWFSTLQRATRVELFCGLLQFCSPVELRFYGSCLEDLARNDYNNLKSFEVHANAEEPSIFFESFKRALISNVKGKETIPLIESKRAINNLILGLSLLRSNNSILANYYYSAIMADLFCEGYDSSSFTEGLLATWDYLEDIILVYSIASYHPAFSHFQKYRLFERLRSILYLYLKKERGVNICRYNSEFLENSSLLSFLDEFSRIKSRRSSLPCRNRNRTTCTAGSQVKTAHSRLGAKQGFRIQRRALSENNLMFNHDTSGLSLLDTTLSSVEGKSSCCSSSFDSHLKYSAYDGFLSESSKLGLCHSAARINTHQRNTNNIALIHDDLKSFRKPSSSNGHANHSCCLCSKMASLQVDCDAKDSSTNETSSTTSKRYPNSVDSCLSPPNNHFINNHSSTNHPTTTGHHQSLCQGRGNGSCVGRVHQLPRRHSSASSHLSTPPSEDYLINSLHQFHHQQTPQNFDSIVHSNKQPMNSNLDTTCISPSNCFDKTITSSDPKAFEKMITSSTSTTTGATLGLDSSDLNQQQVSNPSLTQQNFAQICLISSNSIPAYVSHPGLTGIPFDAINCIDAVNQSTAAANSAAAAALFAQSNLYHPTPLPGVYPNPPSSTPTSNSNNNDPHSSSATSAQLSATVAAFQTFANGNHNLPLSTYPFVDSRNDRKVKSSGRDKTTRDHPSNHYGRNPRNGLNSDTDAEQSSCKSTTSESSLPLGNGKTSRRSKDLDDFRVNHSHPKANEKYPTPIHEFPLMPIPAGCYPSTNPSLITNIETFFSQTCQLGQSPTSTLFPVDTTRVTYNSTSSDHEVYAQPSNSQHPPSASTSSCCEGSSTSTAQGSGKTNNMTESNSAPNLNNTNEFPQLPKPAVVIKGGSSEVPSSNTPTAEPSTPGSTAHVMGTNAQINNISKNRSKETPMATVSEQTQTVSTTSNLPSNQPADKESLSDSGPESNLPEPSAKSSEDEARFSESNEECLFDLRSSSEQLALDSRNPMNNSSWSSVIGSSSTNGTQQIHSTSSKPEACLNSDSQSSILNNTQSSTPNKNYEVQYNNGNNPAMIAGNYGITNFASMPQQFTLPPHPSLITAGPHGQYPTSYAYPFHVPYPNNGGNPQTFFIAAPQFAAYNLFSNIQTAAAAAALQINPMQQVYRPSHQQNNQSTSAGVVASSNTAASSTSPAMVTSTTNSSGTRTQNDYSPSQSPPRKQENSVIINPCESNNSNPVAGSAPSSSSSANPSSSSKAPCNQFSSKNPLPQQQSQLAHGFNGVYRLPPPVHASGLHLPSVSQYGHHNPSQNYVHNFFPTGPLFYGNPVLNFVNPANPTPPNPGQNKNSRISCYHCGNSGHKASQCTVAIDRLMNLQQQPQPPTVAQSFNLDFNRAR